MRTGQLTSGILSIFCISTQSIISLDQGINSRNMNRNKNSTLMTKLPYICQTSMYVLLDTWPLSQKVLDCVEQQLLIEAIELRDPKLGHFQQIVHKGLYLPAWHHNFLPNTCMQPQYLNMYFAHLATVQAKNVHLHQCGNS